MVLGIESISDKSIQSLYFFAVEIKVLKTRMFRRRKGTGQIMKNVKAPTSDSYQDYLVSRLKDPSYAALYLETHLEEREDPDPGLLKLALSDVFEALSQSKLTSEQADLHRRELDKVLSQQGSDVIYGLSQWLEGLGLKLTVAVAEREPE